MMPRPAASKNRVQRKAVSLLELMLVIGISSIVLGVAISGLTTLYRLDSKHAGGAIANVSEYRFYELLRRDAHQAKAFAATEDGAAIRFDLLRGGTIEYRIEPSGVVQRTQSGSPAATVLRTEAARRWQANPLEASGLATVEVSIVAREATSEADLAPQPNATVLTLGLDHSFFGDKAK